MPFICDVPASSSFLPQLHVKQCLSAANIRRRAVSDVGNQLGSSRRDCAGQGGTALIAAQMEGRHPYEGHSFPYLSRIRFVPRKLLGRDGFAVSHGLPE